MPEGEIARAYATIGADTSPIVQEMQAMRATVTAQMDALGVALTGPLYPILRLAQYAGTALLAPLRGIQELASAITGPVSDAFEHHLSDFQHWVRESIGAEVSMARFNATLERSGDLVGYTGKQLESMRKNMGVGGLFGGGELLAAQKALLQLQDVRGQNFADTLKLAGDLSNLMGTDLPQAAHHLGMALVNPEHGLRALRHEGILLSKQEMDHISLLRQTQGAYAAQAATLDILRGKIGNATEAMAGTTGGRINQIRNTWNALGKSIGDALLPATDTLARFTLTGVQAFRDMLQPIISRVGSGIKGAMEVANTWLGKNTDLFRYWALTIRDTIGNVIDYGLKIIRDFFPQLQFRDGEAGWKTFSDAVTEGLETLEEYSTNLAKYWAEFKNTASGLWDTLKGGALDFIEYVKSPLFAFIDELGKRLSSRFKIAALELLPGTKDLIEQEKGTEQNREALQAMKDAKAAKLHKGDTGTPTPETGDAIDAIIDDMMEEFDRQERRRKRAEDRKHSITKPGGDVGAPNPSDDYGREAFKFGSAGLADMHKAIQLSVTGGSIEKLGERQARAAEEAVRIAQEALTVSQRIAEKIGNGAAFAS